MSHFSIELSDDKNERRELKDSIITTRDTNLSESIDV